MRTLTVEQDVEFLPQPNEIRVVLTASLPAVERITAAFALAFQGHLLLMTRLRDRRRGWDLPGGGVELGETTEQAMRREVYEETGARLGAARVIAYQWIIIRAPEPKGYRYPYPDSYMVFFRAPIERLDSFDGDHEAAGRGLLLPHRVRATQWGSKNPALYAAALATRQHG